MLFQFTAAEGHSDAPSWSGSTTFTHTTAKDDSRWTISTAGGRLTDAMLSPPSPIDVSGGETPPVASLTRTIVRRAEEATARHRSLARTLRDLGVRCAVVPSHPKLPGLGHPGVASAMTPWGLLGLRPSISQRCDTAGHILGHASGWGIPVVGRIGGGRASGSDICLLRQGVVAIGWSGEGTDKEGALALGQFYRSRGWRAVITHYDPHFVQLAAIFSMLDDMRALACLQALDPAFIGEVTALGVSLVAATPAEAQCAGAGAIALGAGRILTAASSSRINRELVRLGYDVTAIELGALGAPGISLQNLVVPLARRNR